MDPLQRPEAPPTTFTLHAEPATTRANKKPRPTAKHRAPRQPKSSRTGNFESRLVQPATDEESTFRHSGWWQLRTKIRRHLANSGANSFQLDRWDNCGSACHVEYSATLNKHRCRANYCKSRHCQPCMRAKATRLSMNLRRRLSERPDGRYRFVTLTLKNSKQDLAAEIRRLYTCFKSIRGHRVWRRQRGGCFILEVKWSSGRGWHPHLHIITEGEYIPQAELSEAWHHVTGDSFVVDVRPLTTGYDPADYVAKYITKATNSDVWDDDSAAQEWICSSKGVRPAATFGNWRGFKLCSQPECADDWQPIASLGQVLHDARQGQPWAVAILKSLRPGDDDAGGHLFNQPDHQTDDQLAELVASLPDTS